MRRFIAALAPLVFWSLPGDGEKAKAVLKTPHSKQTPEGEGKRETAVSIDTLANVKAHLDQRILTLFLHDAPGRQRPMRFLYSSDDRKAMQHESRGSVFPSPHHMSDDDAAASARR